MILIFSQSKLEASTNNVIEWLEYYNAPYYRINGDDIFDYYLEVHEKGKVLSLEFCPNDINVVWYRRWDNYSSDNEFQIHHDALLKKTFNKYMVSEYKSLSYALFSMFENSFWLSKPFSRLKEDKILHLRVAQKNNLKIPKTYIINNKNRLLSILKNTDLISKSIFNVKRIVMNNEIHVQYTKEIDQESLDLIPDHFAPSLFQEKIEKDYELRVFYLEGEVYSMAIFSQLDQMTEIDFRKYNFEKPNRNVPYELPDVIKKKINCFMKEMNFKTGSIDLIKSKSGDYIFLEINPIGQFGMTSLPCNYYLEKKIAEYLIKKNNEK